jgi:hypothetical protein
VAAKPNGCIIGAEMASRDSRMGMLQWFDTRDIDEFGRSIASELTKRVPPSSLDSGKRKAIGQLKSSHHAIFTRAEHFAHTHPLNFYKRARMGNSFRWALKEAGYPPDLVENWTYELVTLITLESKASRKQGR